MQPNAPVGAPQKEFTNEALEKKFSYAFTRRECIILVNVLRGQQFQLGDMRNKILLNILDEIELTAIQSITNDDYIQPTVPQAVEATPVTPQADSQVTV